MQITSLQEVRFTGTGTSGNTTITSVTVGNTFLVVSYSFSSSPTTFTPDQHYPEVWLSDSTTLNWQRDDDTDGTTIQLTVYVVEVSSATVQSGQTTVTGTSNTGSVTAVDLADTFLVGTFRTTSSATGSAEGEPDEAITSWRFTSTTVVTCAKQGTGSTSVVRWYAVESTDLTVQSGTLNVNSTSGVTDTITGVTLADTFLVGSHDSNEPSYINDEGVIYCDLSSTTTVRGRVGFGSATNNYRYFVVERSTQSVQTFGNSVANASSGSDTVTAIDQSLTIVVRTVLTGGCNTDSYQSGFADTRFLEHWFSNTTTMNWRRGSAVSDTNLYRQAVEFPSTDPFITDVETDEEFRDGDTALTITGGNFEASQGTGKVEISDNATYGSGNVVSQTVTSWAAGSIDFTAVLGAMSPGTPRYLWVTNDSGDRNAAGFVVHIHRKIAWELSASSNIPASGANTTAQLTAPSGKTTGDFGGGRIQDDENPTDTVDIDSDEYREDEWSIEATADAVTSGVYEFRVLIDGKVQGTISVTPTITISTGAQTVNMGLVSEDDSANAITAVPGAVSVALGLVSEDDSVDAVTPVPANDIAIGLVSEDDAVDAITPVAGNVNIAVGLVSEDDSADAITPVPTNTIAMGLVSEDDSVHAATAASGNLNVAMGLASEDDSVDGITMVPGGITEAIALANEDDSAHAMTAAPGNFNVGLGLASEDDSAHGATVVPGGATRTLGLVGEDDTAHTPTAAPGGVSVAAGLVSEDDSAHGMTAVPTNSIALGLASEDDTAAEITVEAGGVVNLGLVSEDDSVDAITAMAGNVNVAMGLASEDDSAHAPTVQTTIDIAVGLVSEDDSADAMTVVPGALTVGIGLVSEDDSADAITPVSGGSVVAMGLVSEDDSVHAPTAVPTNSIVMGLALEDDSVHAPTMVPGAITQAIGLVSEDDVANLIAPTILNVVIVGLVSEDDSVHGLTAVPGTATIGLGLVTEEDIIHALLFYGGTLPIMRIGPPTKQTVTDGITTEVIGTGVTKQDIGDGITSQVVVDPETQVD